MHTSAADTNTPSPPTPKPKWAFARQSFPCGRCQDVIGQGEAYRVSTNPRRFGLCENCSLAIDPEHGEMPARIEDRSPLDELRDELAQRQAARHNSDFSRFNTPAARAAWKREATAKPAPAPGTPATRPFVDPRGQGRNRHGIAAAMRQHIDDVDRDFKKRQSGERDE